MSDDERRDSDGFDAEERGDQGIADEPVRPEETSGEDHDSDVPFMTPFCVPPPRFLPSLDFRLRRLVVVVAVVAVAVGGVGWWWSQRGLPDDVAFEVAGKQTKVSVVRDRAATLRALYGVQMPTDAGDRDDYWRDVAQSMVIGDIIADQAESRGTRVPREKLEAALTSYLESTFGEGEAGRSTYLAALANAGTSDGEVRAEIERQLEIAALFDDVTSDVKAPSEADAETSFSRWSCYFDVPERRALSNIVVLTRDEANRALREIGKGRDFAAVAREISVDQSTAAKGGDLGLRAAAELESSYAEAAFTAKPGVPFGPVQTADGWNVGVARRVAEPKKAEFALVAKEVAQLELSDRKLTAWRQWLEKALKEADVEYADDYRPADPASLPDQFDDTPQSGNTEECG